jgi:anti-sigma B factor antagonist
MTMGPDEFSVSTSREEDGVVIEAGGELDLAVSRELEAALADDTLNGGHVVLDLTELSFMDSTGLRVILVAAERFGKAGTAWAVVLPEDSPVRRVLSLSETESELPLFETRESALDSVREGGG